MSPIPGSATPQHPRRPNALTRYRRTRLLLVGTECDRWQRLARTVPTAGHDTLTVIDADAALTVLAVEPGVPTLIIAHHDEAAALAHLARWTHQVAPKARLLTVDHDGVLHGFGADGSATGPAGPMMASVRRLLRNEVAN